MSGDRARRTGDESGAVAVLVAVLSVVIFGLAAIVVDLGFARDVRTEQQAAADAAALAATNVVYASGTAVPNLLGAVAAAKTYAQNNGAAAEPDWASCTDTPPAGYHVPSGSTPCVSFYPDLGRPSRVRVALPPKQTPTFFAGVVGVRPPLVRGVAESSIRINRQAPCALCILRTGVTHDLSQGDVRVRGGAISFNGNLTVGSNGVAAADGPILVEGTAGGSVTSATPTPTTGSPRQPDPLAAYPLPGPPTYGQTVTSVLTNPCTQGPGFYGSVTFPLSGTCTLSPGVYVVAGTSTQATNPTVTWSIQSQTVLRGTGVTLVFTCGTPSAPRTCNAGELGASLEISGQGSAVLSPPTSGPLSGFTVIYDRNSGARMRITGNASSTITGTVYMPNGIVGLNGNGCIDSYSVLFIAGTLVPNGNSSCLNMTYVPSESAQLEPDQIHLSK